MMMASDAFRGRFRPPPTDRSPQLFSKDVAKFHRLYHGFVLSSLHKPGVHEDDVDDVAQEVYIVVYRRLESFENKARATSWLFAICLRVAARYRRRAQIFREVPFDPVVHGQRSSGAPTPEDAASDSEGQAYLKEVLRGVSPRKRLAFMLATIEGMTCEKIALALGVPLGTVHSRLNGAKKELEASIHRVQAIYARKNRVKK